MRTSAYIGATTCKMMISRVKALLDGGEALPDGGEALLEGGEVWLDGGEALPDGGKAVLDGVTAPVREIDPGPARGFPSPTRSPTPSPWVKCWHPATFAAGPRWSASSARAGS